MKAFLLLVALALAACGSSPAAGPTDSGREAFCDPVISAYEQVDASNPPTIRAVVVAIAENSTNLDDINQATFVALGAELSVSVSANQWSTQKIATELNGLCGSSLEPHSGP